MRSFCEVFDCFSVFELKQGLATWKRGERQNRVTQKYRKYLRLSRPLLIIEMTVLSLVCDDGRQERLLHCPTVVVQLSKRLILLLVTLSQLETVVDCEKHLVELLSLKHFLH